MRSVEKSSEKAMPCGTAAPAGLAIGLRRIDAGGPEPAIRGPLDRLEQRLTAERVEAVLVGVIDDEPAAVAAFDERAVSLGPPALGGGRACGRSGCGASSPTGPRSTCDARRDDHVPGRRPGGAALGQHHVVVVAALQDLRAFLREALDDPVVGILPARRRPSSASPTTDSPSSASGTSCPALRNR